MELTQLVSFVTQKTYRIRKKQWNKIIKTQQIFKSEWHNVFTEEINKIALTSNNHKIVQSIDSIEAYPYRTRKYLVSEKGEIKWKNMIKPHKKND